MHQRTIDKKKTSNFFFVLVFIFQKCQSVFDLYKVKINTFLNISSFLAF